MLSGSFIDKAFNVHRPITIDPEETQCKELEPLSRSVNHSSNT